MCLARLIAMVSSLWCFAQLPVIRFGKILPRSDVNLRSLETSLYSINSTLSAQKAHTLRRVRLGLIPPRPPSRSPPKSRPPPPALGPLFSAIRVFSFQNNPCLTYRTPAHICAIKIIGQTVMLYHHPWPDRIRCLR